MKRFNWKKAAAVVLLLVGFAGAVALNPAFDGPETDMFVKVLWYVSLIVILGGAKLAGGLDWALGFPEAVKPRKPIVIYPADYYRK